MRSGGVISSSSTSSGGVLEQTLTAEAASVLKHSLTLARRRGHAHLTPLHVAATLLSSRTSLFRRACLSTTATTSPNNNNNPLQLQCRALELCFNVALNRLPTSSTPPLHQFYVPSLSNALIAALKRAQAHQRRGSIEQQQHQQQPLLAIKVELQSLIISILDDPSVSRVMREAGFSSTCVKNNLEQQHHHTSSSSSSPLLNFHYNPCGGIFSSPSSPDHHHQLPSSTFWHHNNNSDTKYFLPLEVQFHQNQYLPFLFNSHSKNTATSNFVKEEDVKLVLEVLLRNNINNNNNSTKKRTSNTVVVGDSVALTEGLVMEVMRRFEKGQVPHPELKRTRFLKLFEFFAPVSLRLMSRQDVDKGLLELKKKLHLHDHQESVIIYTGDLKWTVDDDYDHRHIAINKYNQVDHLVEEIAGLVDDDQPKLRIMGIASYQTYMRCQMRKPPLEIQWSLQAVSIPSSAATTGLALTLNDHPPNTNYSTSFHESRIMFSSQDQSQSQSQSDRAVMETKPLFMLSSKDEQHNNNKVMTSLCLECSSHFEKEAQQLQPLKSTPHKLPAWLLPHGTQHHQIMDDQLDELKKKWNRMCHSLHQARHNNASQFSQRPLLKRSYSSSSCPWWQAQSKDSNSIFFSDHQAPNPNPGFVPQFQRQQSCMIEFNLGGDETTQKHDQQVVVEPSELGKEMKITLALGNSCLFSYNHELEKVERGELCGVLKENVPWQSETIPSIVEAIIDSKPAITWLMIHGNDLIGKRRLACAVAESFLGSADMLIQLKRKRNENIGEKIQESEIGIITKALKSYKKTVVLVEDIDSTDTRFSKFLSDAFETGNFGGEINRKEANLGPAIFILTKQGEIRAHTNDVKNKEPAVIQMTLEAKTRGTDTNFECLSLDRKRKAVVKEWELPMKSKNLRTDTENKEFDDMNVGLDLNVMAKGGEEIDYENNSEENKPGELSPISSDLTRETENGQNPIAFVESIENAFTFDRSPARDREMAEVFQGKMEKCFDEIICGDQNVFSFRVEERVLEKVCNGCGYFTNSLFEKWVKEVFEKALKKVRLSGREKMGGLVNVRLCLGGGNLEEGLILEDGFMGSCLPNKIQLYYKD